MVRRNDKIPTRRASPWGTILVINASLLANTTLRCNDQSARKAVRLVNRIELTVQV